MKFQVVTLFPDLVEVLRQDGVIGQAIKKGLLELKTINPRDFTADKHKSVDDRPFGGGDGMLMMAEPLDRALSSLGPLGQVLVLSPRGQLLNDNLVQNLAKHNVLTLLCGRYAGIDHRILQKHPDFIEVSIGDYVLSGGELAANVVIDAVARFCPGVLGHENSAYDDSITQGLFEAPAYTRPQDWQGLSVPEILLSGHHDKIKEWKLFVGGLMTFARRPELFHPPKISKRMKIRWQKFALEMSLEERKAFGLLDLDTKKFINYLETL